MYGMADRHGLPGLGVCGGEVCGTGKVINGVRGGMVWYGALRGYGMPIQRPGDIPHSMIMKPIITAFPRCIVAGDLRCCGVRATSALFPVLFLSRDDVVAR